MSESIDYAEMLEIPVNTLNVVKKRGRKKKEEDLKNRVVERVNERLEERAEAPAQEAFAETQESILAEEEREEAGRVAESEDVTDYGEETAVKPKKRFFDSRILIAEFVAVCALCAAILLTNIFMPNSAINTFFENIAGGTTETVKTDDRTYSELTLGRVVSDDIACSVYAPFGGKIANVSQTDGVYTVEIEHTTSFTSVITGLSEAYWAAGDTVYTTIPVGYSRGESEVSVRMYDESSLISSYTVNEENDIVWNV